MSIDVPCLRWLLESDGMSQWSCATCSCDISEKILRNIVIFTFPVCKTQRLNTIPMTIPTRVKSWSAFSWLRWTLCFLTVCKTLCVPLFKVWVHYPNVLISCQCPWPPCKTEKECQPREPHSVRSWEFRIYLFYAPWRFATQLKEKLQSLRFILTKKVSLWAGCQQISAGMETCLYLPPQAENKVIMFLGKNTSRA